MSETLSELLANKSNNTIQTYYQNIISYKPIHWAQQPKAFNYNYNFPFLVK